VSDVSPPRRGDVWYAFTPGHHDDSHQPRPVLVVSVDARNRVRGERIVVPIFSNGRSGPTRVMLAAGTGGLSQDSVVFCDEASTIALEFLDGGPLGPSVGDAVLEEVVRGIRRAIGEVVIEPWFAG
jgi:mRNA-degrading endonuclease toxin of MazEF toxin-antitoxin module